MVIRVEASSPVLDQRSVGFETQVQHPQHCLQLAPSGAAGPGFQILLAETRFLAVEGDQGCKLLGVHGISGRNAALRIECPV